MKQQFESRYRVTIGDINYGGHLGNDKALVIFQDARLQFLNSLGFSEIEIGENLGIIMVEAGVRYLREIFHNEELRIAICVAEIKGKKFSLEYQVFRQPENELVLRGSTAFLIFDYATRKVATMPGYFRDKLEKYHGG